MVKYLVKGELFKEIIVKYYNYKFVWYNYILTCFRISYLIVLE